MKRAATALVRPARRVRGGVTLLTAASLALCLPGHVLAASQAPPAGDAAPTATPPATPPATPSGDPGTPAAAGASELSGQAIERFRAKDYDAAARLFEQAYAIDPNPNYLFNIGRVYEEKRDLRAAVDYYQRFVMEPRVDIGAREQAVQRLRVLKAILNETEAPPPTTSTAAAAPTTEGQDPGAAQPPVRPADASPDPKQSMRLGGYALIGVGSVAVVVGGVFGGLTLAKKNDLDDTRIVEERQSLAHQGKTFAAVSDVTLFTGGALLVAGVVLAVLARKPRASARAALLPSVGRNHAGLTYSLRF